MPARKTAAPKKTVAKKTAAPKKSSSTTAPTSGAEQTAGQKIAQAILDGHLDGDLIALDDALTKRTNQQVAERKVNAAKNPPAKTVSAPPKKKSDPAPVTIEPTTGTSYGVSAKFKPLAGAKVKFVRYKADTDGAKSVVEMMTDKPGNPKGKKVVIPTAALEESKAPRRAAKK